MVLAVVPGCLVLLAVMVVRSLVLIIRTLPAGVVMVLLILTYTVLVAISCVMTVMVVIQTRNA